MKANVFLWVIVSAALAASTYGEWVYEGQWGKEGSGNGEFERPRGIGVAPNGNVYVADTGNNRIQYFTATGSYLGQWGSYGTGNGQFDWPYDVAVDDNSGYVYVVDRRNHRIQYFTTTGSYVDQWGSLGSGDGQFRYPSYVDVAFFVYVVDSGNYRVQSFNPTGYFCYAWGSRGSGEGQFESPIGIAVAPGANADNYVTDVSLNRIQYFWFYPSYHGGWSYDFTPYDVDIAPDFDVYVADTRHDRILYFTRTGSYLDEWGSLGSGNGEFIDPMALSFDETASRLYVTDAGNHRIQYFKYDETGVVPSSLGRVKAVFR